MLAYYKAIITALIQLMKLSGLLLFYESNLEVMIDVVLTLDFADQSDLYKNFTFFKTTR